MSDSLIIPNDEKPQVPDTQAERIKELLALPPKEKQHFVPPVGMKLKIGPCIYRVAMVNFGKLRFTAKLWDVIIEGVNDAAYGESLIIDPHTGVIVGE